MTALNTENIQRIQQLCSAHNATLIAVSKTKPIPLLQAAYDLGLRDFGENKVQELQNKEPQLPADVRWHMIGHLQRNKVKYIAPFVYMIHSVDSLRLLEEINKRAKQQDRVIKVLLQIHIAAEETKFGLDADELHALLTSDTYQKMQHISISGLMGMATFTDDTDQIKREFGYLKQLFDHTKATYFAADSAFQVLSMGMSGDYELALAAGSTMVRIGSLLFGSRAMH